MEDKKKFSLRSLTKKEWLLVLLVGILLVIIVFPEPKAKEQDVSSKSGQLPDVQEAAVAAASASKLSEEEEYITYNENKLKQLLEKTKGVGKAEVIMTLKASKEQVVLKDEPYNQESLNEADAEGGSRISSDVQHEETTVMITTKSGETIPYVLKEQQAEIEGIVVLCEGGSDGTVAANIAAACEVLFNVPAHRIQVLPMK